MEATAGKIGNWEITKQSLYFPASYDSQDTSKTLYGTGI